jgi:hypothetical protein
VGKLGQVSKFVSWGKWVGLGKWVSFLVSGLRSSFRIVVRRTRGHQPGLSSVRRKKDRPALSDHAVLDPLQKDVDPKLLLSSRGKGRANCRSNPARKAPGAKVYVHLS